MSRQVENGRHQTHDSHAYLFLWSCEDDTTDSQRLSAMSQGSRWPGFPANPVEPNPIKVHVADYLRPIEPTPSLGGRKTSRRKGGYAGLSNYNNIP